MAGLYELFRLIILKFLLKKQETVNSKAIKSYLETNKLLKIIVKGKNIKKWNLSGCFYAIQISTWINLALSILFDLFLFLELCFMFFFFFNLFDLSDSWEFLATSSLIVLLLDIFFFIRFHSDFMKMSLIPNLIKDKKIIFLIIDILCLNVLSIIAFLKMKEVRNDLLEKKIPLNAQYLKIYKKMNNAILYKYFAIFLIILLTTFGFILLYFYFPNVVVFTIIILMIFLTWYWFVISLFTLIPMVVVTNMTINRIIKNQNEISITQCLFLLRYIICTMGTTNASILLDRLELQAELLKNNAYNEI